MFTLRLLIAGLIAIVPSPDNSSVRIIFVDGEAAYRARYSKQANGEAFHLPTFLSLSGSCKDNGNGCLRLGGISLPEPPPMPLLWFPAQEQIEITWNGAKAKYKAVGMASNFALPYDQTDVGNARWVTAIKNIAPSWSQIDRDCLRSAQVCPVQARLELPGGDIQTCRLATDASHNVYAYKFTDGKTSSPPRAVADLVLIELRVPDGSVKLRASPLGNNKTLAEVDLYPEVVDGVDRLDLFIANLPLGTKPFLQFLFDAKTVPLIMPHGDLMAPLSTLPQAKRHFPTPMAVGPMLDPKILPVAPKCMDLVPVKLTARGGINFTIFLKILDYLRNRPECGPRLFAAQYPNP